MGQSYSVTVIHQDLYINQQNFKGKTGQQVAIETQTLVEQSLSNDFHTTFGQLNIHYGANSGVLIRKFETSNLHDEIKDFLDNNFASAFDDNVTITSQAASLIETAIQYGKVKVNEYSTTTKVFRFLAVKVEEGVIVAYAYCNIKKDAEVILSAPVAYLYNDHFHSLTSASHASAITSAASITRDVHAAHNTTLAATLGDQCINFSIFSVCYSVDIPNLAFKVSLCVDLPIIGRKCFDAVDVSPAHGATVDLGVGKVSFSVNGKCLHAHWEYKIPFDGQGSGDKDLVCL